MVLFVIMNDHSVQIIFLSHVILKKQITTFNKKTLSLDSKTSNYISK